MPKTVSRSHKQITQQKSQRKAATRVSPSKVNSTAKPFTLDQELEPFGNWVDKPLWIPPIDSSKAMAESMLLNKKVSPFTAKEKRWSAIVDEHRDNFTQVREINLHKASIRLPKGKFFVSVTEQKDFDKITDTIPDCVQTRLDEFLAGPGKKHGVKVSYLKPLCVEVDDDLILTTKEDVLGAITKIQDEVFSEYLWMYLRSLPKETAMSTVNALLALPRGVVNYFVERRQKQIATLHAQLEFERRKTALRAARTHGKFRTDGCTYDEMLALTNPLVQADVIEQYGVEQNLSRAKRDRLIRIAAGAAPWFVTLAITAGYLSTLTLTTVAPVVVCDPAFVAEMPGSKGVVLKIGHFDEVGGVTHVEI